MSFYRNIFISALVVLTPVAAQAGGLSPAIEADVAPIIIEEAKPSSSASSLIVPAIIIALIAVAVSNSDSGSNDGAKSIVTD